MFIFYLCLAVHACDYRGQEAEAEDGHEFETILDYIVSSRPVQQRETV